jgi:tRNA(adenine34) deaminase
MREALKEAQKALDKGEIPIGAIIVANDKIIARAHNLTETLNDVTAHAEMQAITSASNYIGGKYLLDCTLYVTIEPCHMCAGALAWSQISKIVYGASETKKGFSLLNQGILHPKTEVVKGILADDCEKILKDFFAKRRK